MLNKAHVTGLMAVPPSILMQAAAAPATSVAQKLQELRALICKKILSKDYLQAQVNGNFIWMRLGNIDLSASQMKKLSREYKDAGWSQVSFNSFHGNLSLSLWKQPYQEMHNYIDGKAI